MEIILWKVIKTCLVFALVFAGVIRMVDRDELKSVFGSFVVAVFLGSLLTIIASSLILIWV